MQTLIYCGISFHCLSKYPLRVSFTQKLNYRITNILKQGYNDAKAIYPLHLSFYLKNNKIYIAVYIMPGVVLGGVVMVVGSSLAGGEIFTASFGSVDYLYLSVFIFFMNLHQFLILCSSKAMMFLKLYFRTSDIYLISLVSSDPSGFHLRTK